MFKLVAGNLLVGLFAEGLFCDDETRINIPELKNQFFNIYEYNDEDREIFYELLKLAQNDLLGLDAKEKGRPYQGFRLYEYIFKRAYNINPPEFPAQIMHFMLISKKTFNEIFVPGLIEAMKGITVQKENVESDSPQRVPCSDGSCIGIINDQGVCNICGKLYTKKPL